MTSYKKRVLMLYNHEDIPEAQFDSVKEAAGYLEKPSVCLNSSMSRNQRLRSGHKLIWVNIGIDLCKEE